MSDKISSNSVPLVEHALVDTLDGRVFQRPTYILPPSPPSSKAEIIKNSNTKMRIGSPRLIALKKSRDSIESDGNETKLVKQPITAKSDIKTPHVPNKYAKTYELEKFKGNRMIIFNHSEYLEGSNRPGTNLDEKALKNTFEKFRFAVHTHSNLTKRELMKTIRNFAQSDFSQFGCVCVAILTHGHDKPGYLEAYDQSYSEKDIFEQFDSMKNPTLAAKPIIFIIQACRGAKPSLKVSIEQRRSTYQLDLDDDDHSEAYHLPTEADMIVFHSSFAGRASIRDPQRGSWFIQSLCCQIRNHAYTQDIESIFRLVRRNVALDFTNSRDWKQMPVVTSTLLRELYLGENPRFKIATKYPWRHSELHELPEKPKEPRPKTPDESPDSSLSPVQPIHMPCSCFLEYFEYLKKCLEGFVYHNPEDTVAKNLLKMIQKVGDGSEYNFQKFSFIQSMWEHFEANMDKFPPESSKFMYRKYI